MSICCYCLLSLIYDNVFSRTLYLVYDILCLKKLIYLELLISHFIRPLGSAELRNVARASKSFETPVLSVLLVVSVLYGSMACVLSVMFSYADFIYT
jgi:hypothetical protein